MRWVWITTVGLRLVAASVMMFGPATDTAAELRGWDVARFQEIADAPGRHWTDVEVEYPPGTVIIIEAIASDDVVGSHRRLVAASLLVDLGIAGLLARRRPIAGVAHLVLGTALIPAGLLRFDLWAAIAAVAAADRLLDRPSPSPSQPPPTVMSPPRSSPITADLGFAALVTIGAAIKLWPALLIAAAWAIGRRRAATLAAVVGATAAAGWIAVSGLDGPEQVASLRGATGWHVESLPGTLTALLTDDVVRKEADAYRIGSLVPEIVTAARIATLVAVAALATRAARARRAPRPGGDGRSTERSFAIVALGSVAALIASAPLVSPQFVLWLTPWAALLVDRWPLASIDRRLVAGVAATAVITGATLAVFGPPGVDHPVAALLLLTRNVFLLGIVVLAWQALGDRPAPGTEAARDQERTGAKARRE